MQSALAEEAMPLYTTAAISDIQQSRQHHFAARVISRNTTQLSSEISANIKQFHVRPGDRVEQGQALVSLDCRDAEDQLALLQSRLAETRASVQQSERLASRLGSLRERQLTDTLSVDDALSEVTRQQARLSAVNTEIQLAQRQINRCVIYAPFDAAITAQLAGEGERSSPGTLLLSLQQLSDAEIEVSLPVDRFNLSYDLQAEFKTRGSIQPVELLRKSAVIDTPSRSQQFWFSAPDGIAIGTSGELVLTEPQPYLPAEYIVSRSGQLGVFLINEDKPVFVPLANAQEGRPYPVTEELEAAQIVIQGQQWLQAGATE
jgi:RND family efflux transporter MFP subunit